MDINLNLRFFFDPGFERKLDQIIVALTGLNQQGIAIMKELDDLTAEVAATKGVVDSAVVAIQGLRQQIIDAGTDPAKLQALTDSLKDTEQTLAAAIAAP